MNEEIIVYLTDIRDELQSFQPDPDPNDAFQCAWEWWKAYCVRKKIRNHQFFYDALDRAWLKKSDAESFCNFLHNGRFWRCLA